MKLITSRDNPTVKQLHALATSARERRQCGETLLDGAHLLTVASVSPVFAAITRCVSPLRNRRHA